MRLKVPKISVEEMHSSLERRIAARNARAAKLVSEIAGHDRARRRAAFHIGRCLARMLRDRLYLNAGHRTFADLARTFGLGRAQAFKLVALGERSTAREVELLGVEAAYAKAARTSKRA